MKIFPTTQETYKFVYGPVPSRRLGISLGVSPIPSKICNFSCVYCQLGRTTQLSNLRQRFFPPAEIINEIKRRLLTLDDVDYITIVGEGEPTLSADIGLLIREIKRFTKIPVAVITNGALLFDKEVRNELLQADLVLPSLDTVREETFKKINRPYKSLHVSSIVEGLVAFREEYRGSLWLETMLVEGINDDVNELSLMAEALKNISPDYLFLNIPIRPPAENWVRPPGPGAIAQAVGILGKVSRLVVPRAESFNNLTLASPEDRILEIIGRHPMRESEIASVLKNYTDLELKTFLSNLGQRADVVEENFQGERFWRRR